MKTILTNIKILSDAEGKPMDDLYTHGYRKAIRDEYEADNLHACLCMIEYDLCGQIEQYERLADFTETSAIFESQYLCGMHISFEATQVLTPAEEAAKKLYDTLSFLKTNNTFGFVINKDVENALKAFESLELPKN